MKATFGPVYVEGELIWLTGKTAKYESPSTAADIDKEGLGAYILAKVKHGSGVRRRPVRLQLRRSERHRRRTRAAPPARRRWVPALLFGNANLKSWRTARPITAAPTVADLQHQQAEPHGSTTSLPGSTRRPKVNVEGAITYMTADKKPNGVRTPTNYGWEVDLKATYKIYDNLTYMVGAGYFWTGDYFKGTNAEQQDRERLPPDEPVDPELLRRPIHRG